MEGGGSLFIFSIYIYSSKYNYEVTLTTGGKILIQNYRESLPSWIDSVGQTNNSSQDYPGVCYEPLGQYFEQ